MAFKWNIRNISSIFYNFERDLKRYGFEYLGRHCRDNLIFGNRVASGLVIRFPFTGNFSLTKWTLLGDSEFALAPAAASSPA